MEQVFIKTEQIKIELDPENQSESEETVKTERPEENYNEEYKSPILDKLTDMQKTYNLYHNGFGGEIFSNELVKVYNSYNETHGNNSAIPNANFLTAYNREDGTSLEPKQTLTQDVLGKVYENGKINRLTCIQCNKTFKNRANLKNHIKYVHAEDESIECSECLRTFKSQVYLRSHVNSVHAKIQEVQCEHCEKIFMNKKKLNNHIYYTHRQPGEQVSCKVCAKTYKSSYNLKIHMRYVHPEGDPHPCPLCYKTFKVEMLLQRHMKWAHPDDGLVYKCQECHKILPSMDGYKTHMKNVHLFDRATCDICRQTFKTKKSLVRHFKTIHKDKDKEVTLHIPGEYICQFCQRTFTSNTSLFWHTERYHAQMQNLPNNLCIICNTKFSTYAALHRHLTSVHSLETAKCQICFKEFKSQINLQSHIRITHAPPEATKTCDICQKTFKCPLHLRMHIATVHVGGEFPCDICQKTFASIKYLNKHKKSHSDSRDYQCDLCLKMYKNLHSVTKHKRQVHNGVKCTICNIKQPNIDDHMKKCHPDVVVVSNELGSDQSMPGSDHSLPESHHDQPEGHDQPESHHDQPESHHGQPESDQAVDLCLGSVKKEPIDEIRCSKCGNGFNSSEYDDHAESCQGLPMVEVTIKTEPIDEGNY